MSKRRVFVALLLSAALLVCHGLFGASHVLAHGDGPVRGDVPAISKDVAEGDDVRHAPHAPSGCCAEGIPFAHHPDGYVAGEHTPDGAPSASGQAGGLDYFAVLLVLAVVAMMLAAFRGASHAPAGVTPPWASGARRALASSPFPRGPSLPLLQVFRL